MRIKVRYFATLRELAGRAEETFELENDACLGDLIEIVASRYGEETRRYLYANENQRITDPSVRFLINGRDSRMLQGLKTKLVDGDTVTIIPPVGGG